MRFRDVAREHAERLANRATQTIGLIAGRSAPHWYVSEYPKSGGTWLGQLVAGYLDLPFPQHYWLPLIRASVVHNHWLYSPRLGRCLYLHRDGRDVMVSLYFHRMRRLASENPTPHLRRLASDYQRAFGPGYDRAACAANLPRFIELEVRRPRGSRHTWAAHIRNWCVPRRDGVVYIGYAALLRAPVATLSAGLAVFVDGPVDATRLEAVVERFSFERQSGRRPGEEDPTSFLRKGVAGDWKNHFSREAAQVFDHHFGDALIALGYEHDRTWVDRTATVAS